MKGKTERIKPPFDRIGAKINMHVFNAERQGYLYSASRIQELFTLKNLILKWTYNVRYWYWKLFQKDVVRK